MNKRINDTYKDGGTNAWAQSAILVVFSHYQRYGDDEDGDDTSNQHDETGYLANRVIKVWHATRAAGVIASLGLKFKIIKSKLFWLYFMWCLVKNIKNSSHWA